MPKVQPVKHLSDLSFTDVHFPLEKVTIFQEKVVHREGRYSHPVGYSLGRQCEGAVVVVTSSTRFPYQREHAHGQCSPKMMKDGHQKALKQRKQSTERLAVPKVQPEARCA